MKGGGKDIPGKGNSVPQSTCRVSRTSTWFGWKVEHMPGRDQRLKLAHRWQGFDSATGDTRILDRE